MYPNATYQNAIEIISENKIKKHKLEYYDINILLKRYTGYG